MKKGASSEAPFSFHPIGTDHSILKLRNGDTLEWARGCCLHRAQTLIEKVAVVVHRWLALAMPPASGVIHVDWVPSPQINWYSIAWSIFETDPPTSKVKSTFAL